MRHLKTGVSAIVCILAMGAAGATMAQALEADLIMTGGDIYTPDGWAEAMAVKDGVIIAVGDAAEVASHRTEGTNVIELDDAAVFPGLHDLHVHPMGAGDYAEQCRWAQGAGPDVVLQTVADCVAEKDDGEWIVGSQWDAASFGDTPPNRWMLDEVTPDNPTVLTDISGHSVWANSLALEAAGIDEDTPNPPGGIIERDEEGRATGILRESGAALVRAEIPPATPEDNAESLEWALDKMLSLGITSYTDAYVGPAMMEAYDRLADRGVLKQRIRGCVIWSPGEDYSKAITDVIAMRNLHNSEHVSMDCIKVVLDGVPTDGHTAAMVEPYADAEGMSEDRATGITMVGDEALKKAVTAFDANGLTVKFHAAGDAAVRQALDAIAAAREANGFSGVMHDSGHNSFVQMSDIKRAREIGATFEMSPYIWYPNPIIPDIAKAIGPERMKRWIPVKDAFDAGALVVPGSDWPVVPLVDPWIGIETLVTRQAPGGKGEVLGAREKISLEQAFQMFTVNSAIHMGQRNLVGTLEKGMLADMVVVDQNPFDVPEGEIHQTRVLMTLIDGEIVYRNEEQ